MPAPVSKPDDPALLRIEGAIATITLNRPAAFNSINLAIAQKLEQLAAYIEGADDIRVVVLEGEGRAFSAGGDLQTIGAAAEANTVTPVVGELLKHYHAFIEIIRRMPKISLSSVHGSAAGAGMGLAFVTDLCIARRMPNSRRPMPRSACRRMADLRSASSTRSAPAARCRFSWPRTILPRSRPRNGDWLRRSFPPPS